MTASEKVTTAKDEKDTGKVSNVLSSKKALKINYKKHLKSIGSRINLTAVLVVGLVVAAYFIGNMKTEIDYLKKGSASLANPAGQAQGAAGAQAQPDPVADVEKSDFPPVTDDDKLRGNPNAKIILVEYSDLECPYCKQFHTTMEQLLSDYGDDVAWVYRHYPLDFHVNAQKESEAAECVNELAGEEKFWEFIDGIFEVTTSNGTGVALDELAPMAGKLGLNEAEVQSCIDSSKYEQFVKDEFEKGTTAGVVGTPSTFVVSEDKITRFSGALPIAQVKQIVDEALK